MSEKRTYKDTRDVMTRRHFMLAAGAVAATGFAPERTSSNSYFPITDTDTYLQPVEAEPTIERKFDSFDVDYVAELLDHLNNNREPNPIKQIESITNNLRQVLLPGIPDLSRAMGSALMIDESGIYLTSRHLIRYVESQAIGQAKIRIKDPLSSTACQVEAAMFSPDSDIAIMYAPTGMARQPIVDMCLSIRELQQSETLWAWGYYPVNDTSQLSEAVRSGTVDKSVIVPDMYDEFTGTQRISDGSNKIAVRNMASRDGMSGSPVVDGDGRVVAVVSGDYKSLIGLRGAVVIPISRISKISQNIVLDYKVQ